MPAPPCAAWAPDAAGAPWMSGRPARLGRLFRPPMWSTAPKRHCTTWRSSISSEGMKREFMPLDIAVFRTAADGDLAFFGQATHHLQDFLLLRFHLDRKSTRLNSS